MYSKPHLSYDDQVALITGRGLICPDHDEAVALLKSVGYYRFSAYVYPFRSLLDVDERQVTSPAHYRSDEIREGTTLGDVEALWRFDRKLRLIVLDALETVEIGLRTKVAHVLGARDTFGHVHRDSLDEEACSAPIGAGKGGAADAYEDWVNRYTSLQERAKSEDFVRHNLFKYGDPLPVWVAVEILDLGALVRLFSLMDKRDQNAIAKEVGVSGGPLLSAWLRQINYLRNLCAHHSRLWNRTLTLQAKKFNPAQAGSDLTHVASSGARDKIYVLLAILGYLVRNLDPKANWPLTLRTHLKKFPELDGITVHQDMGFPEDWADQPLWNTQAAK